jgi:hypothetical protein
MSDDTGTFRLDAELSQFLQSGLSITLCSRNADLVPSVAKALACRVSADGQRITVYAARPRARDVLRDAAAGGRVAVAASLPSTHRTVQLKGRLLDVADLPLDDAPVVAAGIAALRADLAHYGFPPEVTATYLHFAADDSVALTIAIDEAFEQTPGPNAGARLT